MSEARPAPDPSIVLSDLWHQGDRPDVQEFLRQTGPLTPTQLVAVLSIDQWQRWHINDCVQAESYFQLNPDLAKHPDDAFDLVWGEFLLAEEMGQSPSCDTFAARFPQFAEHLRRQSELHEMIESGYGEDETLHPAKPSTAPQQSAPLPPPPSQAVNPTAVDRQTPPSGVLALPPERDWPTIPGYEIRAELGRGGMGRVFKALHLRLKRIVALKVIRKDRLSQNPEALSRFRREAQAAGQLSHPNIVVVYDADWDGDSCYLAMEYVEGVNLHELVKDAGPLSIEVACDYIRQAALGLQHAYERGMVHRDIKPANLLVTVPRTPKEGSGVHVLPVQPEKPAPLSATGKPIRPLGLSSIGLVRAGVVKILDMGMALVKRAADSDSALSTEAGTLMGTPDFIAPEQAEDSHKVDIRADLYSLGCTFYFLLTGKPPFGEYPLIKKLLMHRQSDPRPVEELRPDVPQTVRVVLRKLLAKFADNRYQTPAELCRDLTAIMRGEKVLSTAGNEGRALREDTLSSSATFETPKKPPDLPYIPSRPPPVPARKLVELPPGVVKAQKIAVLEGHRGWVTSLAFSPDRKMLVSGSVDGGMRFWDLGGNEPRNRSLPKAHRRDINALAVAANNYLIASGSGNPEDGIRLWDYSGEQPEELGTISISGVSVDTLTFSLDMRLLASAGSEKLVRVWDLAGPKLVSRMVLNGHTGNIKTLAFATNNQTLYSGSLDGTIRVWNLTRFWSKEQAVLEGSWGQVCTLALSPDNRVLAFGGLDQAVRLWDLDRPSPQEWAVLIGHKGVIRLVQFTPDGKSLVSVCDGGQMILWDVLTGSKQREWVLPRSRLYSVALTQDGRYLATGYSDSIVLFRLYPRREQPS